MEGNTTIKDKLLNITLETAIWVSKYPRTFFTWLFIITFILFSTSLTLMYMIQKQDEQEANFIKDEEEDHKQNVTSNRKIQAKVNKRKKNKQE